MGRGAGGKEIGGNKEKRFTQLRKGKVGVYEVMTWYKERRRRKGVWRNRQRKTKTPFAISSTTRT